MNGYEERRDKQADDSVANDTKLQAESETSQEAFNNWTRFLDIVKLNVSELKLNTWFKPIKPVSFENNILTISVPSQDYYEMIISRFGDVVTRAMRSVLGENGKIVYEIDPRSSFTQEPELIDSPPPAAFDPNYYRPNQQSAETPALKVKLGDVENEYTQRCFLNPEYTFENFVKGKNNEFATAAAISIANKPGAQYNPLMLYGGVGLGKTHLMQAIGNQIKSGNPGMKIMYVSGPEFTTNFVQSIRTNKAHEFERYYKSLDMLIVDDIQFLEGK